MHASLCGELTMGVLEKYSSTLSVQNARVVAHSPQETVR
jgi:hypothetical protein